MVKRYLGLAAILAFSFQSFPALAYDHDYYHDGHHYEDHRWGHGYVVRRIPPYRPIFWRNVNYLYAEGLFYQYTPAGYIIVEPPVGVAVSALPAGYATVMAQGRPYYYYESTYYTTAPSGYVVTAPPPAVIAATPVSAPAPVIAEARTEYKADIDTSQRGRQLHAGDSEKSGKGFPGASG